MPRAARSQPPLTDQEASQPEEPPVGKSVTWLYAHGWTRTNVLGRTLWVPPKGRKRYYSTTVHETGLNDRFNWDKDKLLRVYLIWHHLKNRRPALAKDRYSLVGFLRAILEDLAETAEILKDITTYDQSEALRAFEHTKGIHGEQLRLLDIARGKYLAAQAAREPDPLAEV
jgi:hypothetical protein